MIRLLEAFKHYEEIEILFSINHFEAIVFRDFILYHMNTKYELFVYIPKVLVCNDFRFSNDVRVIKNL